MNIWLVRSQQVTIPLRHLGQLHIAVLGDDDGHDLMDGVAQVVDRAMPRAIPLDLGQGDHLALDIVGYGNLGEFIKRPHDHAAKTNRPAAGGSPLHRSTAARLATNWACS